MRGVIAIVYIYSLIFLTILIFSIVKFFRVESTQDQIMYAVVFLASLLVIALMKLFAWQIIHRNNLKRDIRKLAEYMDHAFPAKDQRRR